MASTRMWCWALVVAACVLSCCAHDDRDLVARASGDLCFVWGHRLASVNDHLFFMHGNYSFEDGATNNPEPYLYALDLSTSFAVEKNLPESRLETYPLPASWAPVPASQAEDATAVLWYTNDTLYIGDNDSTAVAFNATTHQWQDVSIDGSNVDFANHSSEMAVSIPQSGLSFSLGAQRPGLVRFDASNPENLSWMNQTSVSGANSVQMPEVGQAEMVYVPMGKEGVIILLGGTNIAKNPAPMVDMSSISVYDIATSTWYAVTATGNSLPERRGAFCAVVSASPDQSSFQITIYGGWNGWTRLDYEDVYVLTVPSFRWIQMNATNDFEDNSITNIGRAHHRCMVHNDAQMIVLGGSIRTGTAPPVNESSCKAEYPPIRVLDLNTYSWKSNFDPSMTYSVPTAVSDVIGGDASGGATLVEPEGGWQYTALQQIFSQYVSPPNATATHQPHQHSHSHAGAIAGGVVGGLVALGLVIGVAFFCVRRRSARSRKQQDGLGSYNSAAKESNSPWTSELPADHNQKAHEMSSSSSSKRRLMPELDAGVQHSELEAPLVPVELEANHRN